MSETSLSSIKPKANKKMDVFEGTAPEVKQRTKSMLMYLIVFAIIMMFAGFTSAFIVKSPEGYWVHPEPVMGLKISNVLIVISSLFLFAAGYFSKKNNRKMTTMMLVATFLCGLGFTWSQWSAWNQLNDKGLFVSHNKIGDITAEYGKDYMVTLHDVPLILENGQFYKAADKDRIEPVTNEMKRQQDGSTSMLFLFIAVHAFHLILGLIYLLVNTVRSIRGVFDNGNVFSIRSQGIYWHFMGILWLYLYVFLFIIY